ncbi:MAG TPA: hypothetical protein ENF42_03300 [Candidatus Bathyarchaeota archaeon]|nr:MAG: hypothetical protein CW702_02875 [Candidatus Bathyarchaeota archaeon]HDN01981.1 hypothetical protein [Candidatus Bathyarchaeota archaeon]
MSLLKLRLSMIGTLTLIIGMSTLFLTIILNLLGITNLLTIALFIVFFNVLQWLMAPYLIDAMYHTRKITRHENPRLYSIVERLSRKSGIKMPDIMIARIPIPNAFAYGSPLTGNRVAVTTELLNTLEEEEVEAVIGHELGHLKHRDVQIMMFVSILPALFYYIGYSLIWSARFSRDERDNAGLAVLIGLLSIVIYWVLTLFTLYLSRLREYYADRHSVSVVDDGARKLSEALAKIAYTTERVKRFHPRVRSLSSFKALFISDPDSARRDLEEMSSMGMIMDDRAIVERYLRRRITGADRLAEIFSTHPNLVKRLRALQELS